jgi:hypothetical protein
MRVTARFMGGDTGVMDYVRGRVVRWVDYEFPEMVEVEIVEADGNRVALVDKVPVFYADSSLTPDVPLPVDLNLDCDVLRREQTPDAGEIVTVLLHHYIEDEEGRTTFRMRADQVFTSTTHPS